jgi:hypothetical protein
VTVFAQELGVTVNYVRVNVTKAPVYLLACMSVCAVAAKLKRFRQGS